MWIALTETAVSSALSGPELAAYRERALAPDQADPLPAKIARTVRTVRGYVAACSANRLGPEGTIPDELEEAALSILIYALASRLPLPTSLTERLRTRRDDATTLLEQTSRCKFAVEQPAEVSDEDIPGAGRPRVSAKARYFSRAAQEGV